MAAGASSAGCVGARTLIEYVAPKLYLVQQSSRGDGQWYISYSYYVRVKGIFKGIFDA